MKYVGALVTFVFCNKNRNIGLLHNLSKPCGIETQSAKEAEIKEADA